MTENGKMVRNDGDGKEEKVRAAATREHKQKGKINYLEHTKHTVYGTVRWRV